jgi:hypothetical protein
LIRFRMNHRQSGLDPGHAGAWHATPWQRAGVVVVAVPLVAVLLCACGSSSSTASSAEVKRMCKEVEAVLSDGPEPAADPLGYAQAQILPLRRIHTSDRKLAAAIHGLAGAYQALAAERHVDRAANSVVAAAARRVDAICPGAAS